MTGYDNRGLSSACVALSLVVAAWVALSPRKKTTALISSVVVFLVSLSFVLQRDQQIRSWDLQRTVLADLMQKADALQSEKPIEATLLGLVPVFLPDNYNDQFVFRHPWDFGFAITLLGQGKFSKGGVLVGDSEIQGEEIVLEQWWKSPVAGAWFYRYHPTLSAAPPIGKIESVGEARRLIEEGLTNPSYQAPPAAAHVANPTRLYDWFARKLFQARATPGT